MMVPQNVFDCCAQMLNPIHTGFLSTGVVPVGEGGSTTPCNSFVFNVTQLKFSTELL